MNVRFVDGWIRLPIMFALGFWQLGQGSPYRCAQLKGGVSSTQQLDTSDIHVSQLINDIDHTVGIVGNAIRRGPVYENPVNADFAEFSAELKAGSSLAQQYSPCVQQYKNAYPHYLKAADLMEEYTRVRLTASAATLKSINQQMGAESNTGSSFFTAARKCSWQVGQNADVFNSNGSNGRSNSGQPIPVPSPGPSPSPNPAPKSTSRCVQKWPSSPAPNSCGKWTGIVEGGFVPGGGHPNGPVCIMCLWTDANGYPAVHPWLISAPPNIKSSYEPPGGAARACYAAVSPTFVAKDKYFCPPGPAQPVFTYFYINGINTPLTSPSWRGSCTSEHDTVAQNLLGKEVTSKIPQPMGPLVPIKVSNEIDNMYGLTCNPSGQDPWDAGWLARNCGPTPAWYNVPVCLFIANASPPLLEGANWLRAGSYMAGLTPGDLFECARQAINLPPGVPGPPLADIEATANDPLVVDIANSIVQTYKQESQSGTTNFFVVVAHSQGNFFAEAVAYRIMNSGTMGQQIVSNRLGIVSLGSPTNYPSLPRTFIDTKIVHHTRGDDAINIVALLPGKKPWPPNDPPLWPWPNYEPVSSLFTVDQIVPPSCTPGFSFSLVNCNLANAPFWQRMGSGAGTQNVWPELYMPLLNSHLLDNYLDSPPATRPGVDLPRTNANQAVLPWRISPAAPSTLNCIRRDLAVLKNNLLNATLKLATSKCESTY
jgi:hypothetical protein